MPRLAAGLAHVGRHVRVRTYSSTRPPKTKQSPALSRAMKLSSTLPSVPPRQPLHLHRGVGDDGAHLQPVAQRDAAVADDMAPVGLHDHAVVLGVDAQAVAAAHHEVQRPGPGVVGQRAVAPAVAHLGQHLFGEEAAAQRHAHQVLHQHVQRRIRRRSRLHAAGQRGAARGHRLHQLQRVRRHQRHAAGAPRLVAAAAGALQQPRHALGAADLQHAFHRQEVHAQVQRRGGDHGLERAGLQARLDPFAHALVQRAVVQRDAAGPVGPRVQQQLVPGLGLRAHVGEDQRGAGAARSHRPPAAASARPGARPRKSARAPWAAACPPPAPCRCARAPSRRAAAGAGPAARTALRPGCRAWPTGPSTADRAASGAAAPAPAAAARRACCPAARAIRRR